MARVVHIVDSMNRGGIETFIMNVYRAIDRNKVQFDFIVNTPGGDYEEEIALLGGHVYFIPARNHDLRGYYRLTRNFFRDHAGEYAAVHQHASALVAVEPLYYARRYGVPVRVIHSHNSHVVGHPAHNLVHRALKHCIGTLATHYLGCSDLALAWMFGGTRVQQHAVMIKNGVDAATWAYDAGVRNDMRASLGIAPDAMLVGHVGRFVEAKNHRFVIELFAALRRMESNVRLLLLGTGPLQAEVCRQVQQLGLQDDVLFVGVRDDVPQLMQAMDVFVLPSLYEGLPVTLVEAQAAGLPVVVADTVTREAQFTPTMHYLSLQQSATVWAQAVAEACRNHVRRNVSEQVIAAGFDIKTTAGRLQQLYLEGK